MRTAKSLTPVKKRVLENEFCQPWGTPKNKMKKIDPETLKRWKEDPSNWKLWGMVYYNPEDPRIFPPKPIEWMGWTINFANPKSVIAFIVLLIVALLPVWFIH